MREILQRNWWLILAVGAFLALTLAFVVTGDHDSADMCFAAMIGLAVGATEMMARYRDMPFEPLRSIPGFFYMLINAGASLLAYRLLSGVAIQNPALKILTAGVGAMAFFRSGFFTVKIGSADVAVGPNLILQIFLQALDRAYDRLRATPRSERVAAIMKGVSFTGARTALPALCFNLMQNVSDAETAGIGEEIKGLVDADMSEEAKSIILGLALLNVVGEHTLEAAVDALDNTIQGMKPLDRSLLLDLARLDPKVAMQTLPQVCNELCSPKARLKTPQDVDALGASILQQNISDESKVVLIFYVLVRTYGVMTVSTAMGTLIRREAPISNCL